MRICKHLTCQLPADVWYRGPWCSYHALQFGDAPALDAGAGRPVAAPSPGGGVGPRDVPLAGAAPVLTFEELEEVLALDGWGAA